MSHVNITSFRVELMDIQHDVEGFRRMVELHGKLEGRYLTKIRIDMSRTGWFAADMSAAFGAILYKIGSRLNDIELENIPSSVEGILSKNGFLSAYGRKIIPDIWGTTIPYQRFDPKDDRYFGKYVENEYVCRDELPKMSKGLLKRFRESVHEIFSNAVIHSQTQLGIFACGQCFPHRNRLNFTIADLGIGIRRNLLSKIGLDLRADKAIIWASEQKNTTKRGPIPGGLGLKLLKEFIGMNGGRIQIISDIGYWEFSNEGVKTSLLPEPFPGTVVSIEVDTSDTQSYMLTSELNESDVF